MADKLIKTLNFGTGDTYHLAPEWDNIQNKPEDIGGGGTADSVDWDNVQNKPFGYDYDNPTILVDDQIVEFVSDAGVHCLEGDISIEAGKSYTINYNGTTYKAIAQDFYGMMILGNAGVLGGIASDYPFLIIVDMGELVIMDANESTEPLTLSIKTYPVKKIDPLFIDFKKTYYAFGGGNEDKHLYKDDKFTAKVSFVDFTQDLRNYACFVIDVYAENAGEYGGTLMPLLFTKEHNSNYEPYFVVHTASGDYQTTT